MKPTALALLLGTTLAAALAITGCDRSEASPQPVTPTLAREAGARTVTLTADDTMKFNTTQIYARPGEALAVTLTNRGAVPKTAMAHNWVLLASGVDLSAFASQSVTAAATDYIPASFASLVLASTKLLGPNETGIAEFKAPTTPGRYPFVCTFPGHLQAGMRGELIVE